MREREREREISQLMSWSKRNEYMCGANGFAYGDTQDVGMSVSDQLIQRREHLESREVEERKEKCIRER